MVRSDDPPLDLAGMAEVALDPRGRLMSFVAVPPPMEPPQAWPEPDWGPLLQGGRSRSRFVQARCARVDVAGGLGSQGRLAGAYPGQPAVEVRIEAAAYHGRTVWFAVLPPWAAEARSRVPVTPPTPVGQVSVLVLALALPLGGALLARRNLRLGRGGSQGGLPRRAVRLRRLFASPGCCARTTWRASGQSCGS